MNCRGVGTGLKPGVPICAGWQAARRHEGRGRIPAADSNARRVAERDGMKNWTWNQARREHDAEMRAAGWLNLTGARLRGARLTGVDLRGVDLRGVDLRGVNLRGAKLRGARLTGADLTRADFAGVDLTGAKLTRTYLDPAAQPNRDVANFARADDGRCIGWRTRTSQHCGSTEYTPGVYTAPWFSVAPTECHPGLYCYPAREQVENEYPDAEVIEVRFDAADCHRAGRKWRVKTFEVVS